MRYASEWHPTHWVLASIILLTLPCYCIGLSMLLLKPEARRPTPTPTLAPVELPSATLIRQTAEPTETLLPTPTQWFPPTHTPTLPP